MKKMIVVLLVCAFVQTTWSQSPIAKIDSGTIAGAAYRILFPPAWEGNLILYAHGYEFMGAGPRQSRNPQFPTQMTPFLKRGYAVAASDYQYQGYALPQGVDDTESLRKYFVEKYGEPDTTILVGHSMGGGVTLATIEHFGENYDGGLALCPLSSRPYLQVRKEFDMYATFNGLFPGVAPSLAEMFDLSDPQRPIPFNQLFPKARAIRQAIVARDSALAAAFARRFDLKFDDLPFSLLFNEQVLRDIAQKAGGNPFDNTNTVYSGFPDDLEVNRKAERLAATVDPGEIFGKYDRTGVIDRPVVLLHTLYDQLIPPTYGVTNFENMVHRQGKSLFFTVMYTNGQGHCAFTPEQTGRAFDSLRQWLKTGEQPKPGFLE